ncbi:hypothetical protein LMH73_020200 [Vibrio splendidus]|nr:hypothetical protein [Vibrio splendidus]MCC4882934.1 hypothetical protein [Vibrio splendidus]
MKKVVLIAVALFTAYVVDVATIAYEHDVPVKTIVLQTKGRFTVYGQDVAHYLKDITSSADDHLDSLTESASQLGEKASDALEESGITKDKTFKDSSF